MDMVSYLIGKKNGEGKVNIESGGDYTFADPNNDGNIVVTEATQEEVTDNG